MMAHDGLTPYPPSHRTGSIAKLLQCSLRGRIAALRRDRISRARSKANESGKGAAGPPADAQLQYYEFLGVLVRVCFCTMNPSFGELLAGDGSTHDTVPYFAAHNVLLAHGEAVALGTRAHNGTRGAEGWLARWLARTCSRDTSCARRR